MNLYEVGGADVLVEECTAGANFLCLNEEYFNLTESVLFCPLYLGERILSNHLKKKIIKSVNKCRWSA